MKHPAAFVCKGKSPASLPAIELAFVSQLSKLANEVSLNVL